MKKVDFELELVRESKKIHSIKLRADKTHEGVSQFYPGGINYSVHLNRVLDYAIKFGAPVVTCKEDILAVVFGAEFHDSIEDARLHYTDVKEIAKELGVEAFDLAADIVYALTDEKGRTRAERENEAYFDLIHKTPYAAFLKACDRAANIAYAFETEEEKKYKMYQSEMARFIERITNVQVKDDPRFSVPEELIELLDAFTRCLS